jgi:hypothetical protein
MHNPGVKFRYGNIITCLCKRARQASLYANICAAFAAFFPVKFKAGFFFRFFYSYGLIRTVPDAIQVKKAFGFFVQWFRKWPYPFGI